MGIVIDIYDADETKFQRFKRRTKQKLKESWEWAKDNKDELAIVVPGAIGLIASTAKVVNKHVTIKQEKDLKDLYIYDRSLGRYVELKHKLKQKELAEITRRRNNGEKLSNILLDMRLVR